MLDVNAKDSVVQSTVVKLSLLRDIAPFRPLSIMKKRYASSASPNPPNITMHQVPCYKSPEVVRLGTGKDLSTYPFDLGVFHRPINTIYASSQQWFDRGLVWMYGFNHHEATKCFQRAISCDPTNCMSYWALAYAVGPHYNKPWSSFAETERREVLEKAYDAVSEAACRISGAAEEDAALVASIRTRYQKRQGTLEECKDWGVQYAGVMRMLHRRFPRSLEIAVLCADALMNLAPWTLWHVGTGGLHGIELSAEIEEVLSNAFELKNARQHPGLLHLYIHFMEMSPSPQKALWAADTLLGQFPDAGHLQHMPSHLYLLVGDYRRAVMSNWMAVQADERYAVWEPGINFYINYRVHNYHSLIYAAMFTGQSQMALTAADSLISILSERVLRVEMPRLADWWEGYVAVRLHVLIRFGRWNEIIAQSLPEDQELYCVTTATTYYAKGVAYAATGHVNEAQAQQGHFLASLASIPPTRTAFPNRYVDTLKVAEAMLLGEIEYRRGEFDAAFVHLRRSVELDDALIYNEPWGWMQPARHALAALLLENGRVEEALEVYAEDLGLRKHVIRAQHHPNNIWALHGYHECLMRSGRVDEANGIRSKLDELQSNSDINVDCSCYCRRPQPGKF